MDAKQVSAMLTSADNFTDNFTLLDDCRYLLLQLGSPVVGSMYKEQNRLVDALQRKSSLLHFHPVYITIL